MGNGKYRNGFRLTLHRSELPKPLEWKRPRLVFVDSMSDLFHREVPLPFIREVFGVMASASQHQFQILTKRAERLAELAPKLNWSPNIWIGVSIESEECTSRLELLRGVPAVVRFLSCEPLIGPIHNLNLDCIDWVIVGGESGPCARRMDKTWALGIRDQCLRQGVPFFFKQWGGKRKRQTGRLLEGQTWDELPHAAQALSRAT